MESKQNKRIFYLGADFFGCGWYRCHVPGVALRALGHDVVMDSKLHPDAIDYDVIVFQRSHNEAILEAVKEANARGVLTVYELDDDLWHVDPNNPAAEYWTRQKLGLVEDTMAACRLVTTTTKYLAQLFRRFSKNVMVLPNMLPGEFWRIKRAPRQDGRVILGWAGSQGHWVDLGLLGNTLHQILDEFPNTFMYFAGMKGYPFDKHERMDALPAVPVEQYPKMLAQFDIGVAPLADVVFNRAKSDLKFLEYSMAGVAFVGSKDEPYEEAVKHGVNGYLVQNPKDWLRYIRRLIVDEELRVRMLRSAQEYANTRLIENNVWLWEQAYGFDDWAETKKKSVVVSFHADDGYEPLRLKKRPPEQVSESIPPIEFSAAQIMREEILRPANTPVSIIVLTFNKLDYTKNCFEQLNNVTADYELVVVDNASTDGTIEYLEGIDWADVRVVRNAKNRGYAAGCNQGVAVAKHDFICLLNNDAYPFAGWLDAMVAAWADDVGAVGSKLVYPDGKIQHCGITFDEHFVPMHGFYGMPYFMLPDPPEPMSVPGVTAACLLTTKERWGEVGGMDEGFIGGQYEDVDFNLKLREKGYAVLYQPASVLVHYHHKSFGQDAEADRSMKGNYERLVWKWQDKMRFAYPEGMPAAVTPPVTTSKDLEAKGWVDILLSPVEGMLLCGSDGTWYLFEGGQKRRIPDLATLRARGFSPNTVLRIRDDQLHRIPSGPDLPSALAESLSL